MSRNPHEDIRKKRRRQRRQVEWEYQQYETVWLELSTATWDIGLSQLVKQVQRFNERLPEIIEEWVHNLRIWFVVHRTIRNPWQAECWWRV